jgi:4-amino-4-deoxychorismate lyase
VSNPLVWTLGGTVFRPGGAVPVSDRAFRYGMSVFETIAVRAGRPLLVEEHLDRLRRACAAAGFAEPAVGPLPAGLPDGMLRIYVTAGDGPPSAPAEAGRVFALFEETVFPTPAEIALGLRLAISRAPLAPELGGWKTGNYWPRVQALNEARRSAHDEALVFNVQGALLGASMANVFLVRENRLVTPALSTGARDGAVRHWLKTRIPVEEALLTVEDVENAGECFLTNSRLGVMPVAAIEGRTLPSRDTGQTLADLYREEFQ